MNLLSAVIITWNEEKNIGRCLDSLILVADEIILLDSFSNDNTVAIAAQNGAEVVQSTFSGYIGQKNKALKLARNDYVDGYYGFVVSRETARLSFLKYQKLKAIEKQHSSMILHNYKNVE